MKYFVFIAFLFSYSFLESCCTSLTEEDRQSKILHTRKSHEILNRLVIISSEPEPELVVRDIAPRDYHIRVEGSQEKRILTVADFLKERTSDQEEWMHKIAAYFHKRDRQKEHDQRKKEFDVNMMPAWQKDNTPEIVACMWTLISNKS